MPHPRDVIRADRVRAIPESFSWIVSARVIHDDSSRTLHRAGSQLPRASATRARFCWRPQDWDMGDSYRSVPFRLYRMERGTATVRLRNRVTPNRLPSALRPISTRDADRITVRR